MTLTVGGLFAGYGGIELALSSVLDAHPAWFVEFDKAPSKVLAHHWPDTPNLGDVTKVDWNTVEPVDIITGGSPCQDLSHAGKRAGMTEGTRSNLWVQMREAINVIRPQLVVWENVRGAYSATADSALEPCPGCVGGGDGQPALRALGRVLGDLADLGYDCRWYGLRAADVGAAHGRFRVFIFATPAADSEHNGQLAAALRRGASAGEGVGRVQQSQGPSADSGLTLLPTPAVNDMGEGKTVDHWDAWTATMQAKHGNGNGHGKPLSIEAQRLLPTPTTAPTTGNGHARNLGGEAKLLPTPVSDNSRGLPSASTDYASLANVACALLPTPRATDGTKGGPNQRGSSGDLMLPSAVHLLPTPSVADGLGGHLSRSGARSNELLLPGVAKYLAEPRLLPTPRTQNNENRQSEGYGGESGNYYGLIHGGQDWREYAPAIARAEHATGRTAPPPTEPGPKGNPRLSPAFVEWLMMLPAGHVTDPAIGLTRNEQLKALGNGVVPAQCAAALRTFLWDAYGIEVAA